MWSKKTKTHYIVNGKALCGFDVDRLDQYGLRDPGRKTCKFCKKVDSGKIDDFNAKKKPIAKKKKQIRNSKSNKFYKSEAWYALRYRVLVVNDGCCELCGRSKHEGVILHVDHIKPRSKYPELALSINNMQVLCAACNYGKSNKDETDWRSPRLAALMGEAME